MLSLNAKKILVLPKKETHRDAVRCARETIIWRVLAL
jgi:hypothetical protein